MNPVERRMHMSLGYMLSLIILAVSFVALIVIGIVAAKQVKPTLNKLQETQSVVDDHVEHFTRETEVVQTRVNQIVERVEQLQVDAETRIENFEELSTQASLLGDAITRLNNQRTDISKGIARNTFNELKTDGPKIAKTFSRAIKRTFEKQKARQHQV